MDGSGHKVFAPIFGCGMSALITSSGLVPLAGSLLPTVLIATVCSSLTATLPDADLIALKPASIIKGTAKKRYSQKYKREYYYITISQQEFQRRYPNRSKRDNMKIENGGKGVYIYYDKSGTNSFAMRNMALIFKIMGIKKHRGWQSHSPLLWIPFWIAMTLLAYSVLDIGPFIGCIVMGLGLGWTSHLVGDLFTLDGLPLLPKFWTRRAGEEVKIAPVGGRIAGHRIFSFARASNKIWIAIICFAFINLFGYLLTPDLFFACWNGVGKAGNSILPAKIGRAHV